MHATLPDSGIFYHSHMWSDLRYIHWCPHHNYFQSNHPCTHIPWLDRIYPYLDHNCMCFGNLRHNLEVHKLLKNDLNIFLLCIKKSFIWRKVKILIHFTYCKKIFLRVSSAKQHNAPEHVVLSSFSWYPEKQEHV